MNTEKKENTVELDTPVQRGEQEITEVELRKPSSGELRGIQLADLLQMDVGALIKLLPRITPLTEAEVRALDPADLVALGVKVTGFLLQKRTMTDASLAA
ncbi:MULTISPECIES: phage tail assembly protein [Pseudomonas]|uniref:phage tail assembly protein n=1 Tax=Pseudomonas TaxID=286 RepID=UPI001E3C9129|nr:MULTISPECIES: phage tail assembly protein [Pseudomonas]MDM3892800.1 phage tail assembly protein [Pseudomonas juntendi]WBM33140.1 phage tail assembly protein [Pseudomonas sp. NY11382]